MKLSVIIPAHNAEETIERCLDSVFNQTFKDFECVVVADSCDDRTAELARQKGATVISANVRNDGMSRNVGMENSTGDWILFIDADDYWVHEYVFEQIVERIDNTDVDVICFGMVWKHVGVIGAVSNRNNALFPHCTNKCWRRTFIGPTKFPNVKPDSDAGFHGLMWQKNPRVDIWDMPVYYYDFLREGSYSSQLKRTAIQAKGYWRIPDNEHTKGSKPRFSVIIPAYNAANRIRKTLHSIKQQTFTDYELIVVCDSCEDDTAGIAMGYADKVISVKEHHSGYARNHGLDAAEGEYLLFTDDDDWWLHEFAFEMIDQKLKETNPDILYFSFIYHNYGYINPEKGQHLPAFWNKCWRKEFVNDIRCTGEDTYMADVEFQDKALAKGPKVVDWNMPLYFYDYMRQGSMTDKRGW